MREKVLLSWSGGKDSALALHHLLNDHRFCVAALLTTVTKDYNRSSMHGVRTALLEEQAASLGMQIEVMLISKDADDGLYEREMRKVLQKQKRAGVTSVAIGDVFLEDVRKHREQNLAKIGMKAVFPIWGRDTGELARTFIQLAFKAIVTCVDTEALDGSFAGMEFDEQFLAALPRTVDPGGENGEFHTFVYDGPPFRRAVAFARGEVVLRDNRFCFCDLVPASDRS